MGAAPGGAILVLLPGLLNPAGAVLPASVGLQPWEDTLRSPGYLGEVARDDAGVDLGRSVTVEELRFGRVRQARGWAKRANLGGGEQGGVTKNNSGRDKLSEPRRKRPDTFEKVRRPGARKEKGQPNGTRQVRKKTRSRKKENRTRAKAKETSIRDELKYTKSCQCGMPGSQVSAARPRFQKGTDELSFCYIFQMYC